VSDFAIAIASLALLGGRQAPAARAQAQISEPRQAAASSIVGAIIPGSSATLSSSAGPPAMALPGQGSAPASNDSAAQLLTIVVPAGSFSPPAVPVAGVTAPASPENEANDSAAGELGWRAAIAAAAAGLENSNILTYSVTVPGQSVSPVDQAMLHGQIRLRAGAPENGELSDIGTVALSTMQAQARSNLVTLQAALPAGTILASSVTDLPVAAAADDYAFEFDLRVTNLSALQPYVGDIVQGLDTGLTGGATAPSEGVAINIVDTTGKRAGWWGAGRAGSGFTTADPALSVIGSSSETTSFPDLTGGPSPTGSFTGSAFGRSGGVGRERPAGRPRAARHGRNRVGRSSRRS
jgi:hypothetical protein